MRTSRSGFTLIEMSIVLAVIGLIVGGIMGGRTLLQAAKVRGVLADAGSLTIAKFAFRDKYEELPGDFTLATRQWSGVVNGNGDGVISGAGENYQIWKHMELAGYITGSFSGSETGSNIAVPGVNVPEGPISRSAFWHYSWGPSAGDTTFFAGNYNSTMVFGMSVANSWPQNPALRGVEAYSIDQKGDDAMPGTGAIRTFAAGWQGTRQCISAAPDGNDPALAKYNRLKTGLNLGCVLLFMHDFKSPDVS